MSDGLGIDNSINPTGYQLWLDPRSKVSRNKHMALLVHIMARSECFDIDSTLYSGIVIKDDMEQPTDID